MYRPIDRQKAGAKRECPSAMGFRGARPDRRVGAKVPGPKVPGPKACEKARRSGRPDDRTISNPKPVSDDLATPGTHSNRRTGVPAEGLINQWLGQERPLCSQRLRCYHCLSFAYHV
jgi:hypothetical protein